MALPDQFRTDFRKMWDARKAAAQDRVEKGICTLQVVGTRIQVTAPYTEEFVEAAHLLRARWRKRTKVWSFHADSADKVVELCKSVYGESKVIQLSGMGLKTLTGAPASVDVHLPSGVVFSKTIDSEGLHTGGFTLEIGITGGGSLFLLVSPEDWGIIRDRMRIVC